MEDVMTKIAGVPARSSVVPGMAHFAGSGPAGKKCNQCHHWGYWRGGKRYRGCAKTFFLTNSHGAEVAGKNLACKYFERKSA